MGAEFKRTANASGGGSGWAILTYNPHTGEVHNYWAWDHMHHAPTSRSLLVLDINEHSYHMGVRRGACQVACLMQNVNREGVIVGLEGRVKDGRNNLKT